MNISTVVLQLSIYLFLRVHLSGLVIHISVALLLFSFNKLILNFNRLKSSSPSSQHSFVFQASCHLHIYLSHRYTISIFHYCCIFVSNVIFFFHTHFYCCQPSSNTIYFVLVTTFINFPLFVLFTATMILPLMVQFSVTYFDRSLFLLRDIFFCPDMNTSFCFVCISKYEHCIMAIFTSPFLTQ